ncbi:hypothetical protein P262_02543 [Cronobacter malonaticus]|uniref:Uncharacterized protein n=1 Tax=Cronobacter malonaticus TaxID=413503 RepID=V5TY28_9ENTR|nr:hypothetical protein P262_02543 [Cronobacter malonaticus]CCJ92870.1 hypothetical protein BN131_543 [Cronobacter malonaticus 681]CCJ98436.1 hypothetical protein BN130_1006 [Cronobacter malonaticus 507]
MNESLILNANSNHIQQLSPVLHRFSGEPLKNPALMLRI